MKNILFPFFFLVCSALSAQTLSNITLAYSCPCKVTATYDLDTGQSNQPADVLLYFSTDTLGYHSPGTTVGNWQLFATFPQKTAGTHTDFVDCNTALYGQFFFKLEVVGQQQCCQPTTIDLAMIFVEGGTFRLGAAVQPSPDGYPGTEVAITNAHAVTLSNFCISETQVTQAQFETVMGVNPSYFKVAPYLPSDNKPVEQVNWYDAITFCNKLSLMEGKTPVYSVSGVTDWLNLAYGTIPTSYNSTWNAATMELSANGYRLPTEAEWEYAARGGKQSLTAQGSPPDFYYSGGNTANDVAWYSGNNGSYGMPTYGTKPVKQKQPNALGLYDMSGNVWEYCWDWNAIYTNAPVENPTGPSSGTFRMSRGGSWHDNAYCARVSYRYNYSHYTRNLYIGFRLARSSE